jgi:hypothetical protein
MLAAYVLTLSNRYQFYIFASRCLFLDTRSLASHFLRIIDHLRSSTYNFIQGFYY